MSSAIRDALTLDPSPSGRGLKRGRGRERGRRGTRARTRTRTRTRTKREGTEPASGCERSSPNSGQVQTPSARLCVLCGSALNAGPIADAEHARKRRAGGLVTGERGSCGGGLCLGPDRNGMRAQLRSPAMISSTASSSLSPRAMSVSSCFESTLPMAASCVTCAVGWLTSTIGTALATALP